MMQSEASAAQTRATAALFAAARDGKTHEVATLLEEGVVDLDATDEDGYTAANDGP